MDDTARTHQRSGGFSSVFHLNFIYGIRSSGAFWKGTEMHNFGQVSVDRVLFGLIRSIYAGSTVIADDFASDATISGEAKDDGTSVTPTDVASQEAMLLVLMKYGWPIWAEETAGKARLLLGTKPILLVDPLDGTSARLINRWGDVTAIAGSVDSDGLVDRAVISQPALRRIFFAMRGHGAWMTEMTGDISTDLRLARRLTVAKSAKKSVLAWDRTWRFKPKTHLVLSDRDLNKLGSRLARRYKLSYGPNGLNAVLMAMGGQGLMAHMCVAKGGAYDMLGMLLVLEAGGYARAFDEAGNELADPRQIGEAMVMITAATTADLEWVSARVRAILR